MIVDFKKYCADYLISNNADCIAVGIIDFNQNSFESFELQQVAPSTHSTSVCENSSPRLYFDLASVTKPLTNSLGFFVRPEVVDEQMQLLLNHRAGIVAWGLLPRHGWREQLMSYSIQESDVLYSDFSANRFMLEFNKKSDKDLKSICQDYWDKELYHWLDLPTFVQSPQCGFVKGRPNYGEVHDPNAWNIKEFMSHAGLFATIDGLCRTLLNYEKKLQLLSRMEVVLQSNLQRKNHRFVSGWDTPQGETTLAGQGHSPLTFGHLGFTGTSVWIDCKLKVGHVILSNAVKNYWFDKINLNELRRKIGTQVWQSVK